MPSAAADPRLAAALTGLDEALVELRAAGADAIVDARDASVVVRELEAGHRQVQALALDVQLEISRRGLHQPDGHATAKVMVRHTANLSDREAARRTGAARVMRDLPAVAEGHRTGRVGGCQLDRIARLYRNPRISHLVVTVEDVWVELAETLSYRDFDAVVTDWERLVDQDGAGDRARHAHDQRDARITTSPDGRHDLHATVGGVQGAELVEIFRRYVDAEFQTDWAEARARLGDAATVNDLVRTDAQRRADALHAIFVDAASNPAGSTGGSIVVTNLVTDLDTFEAALAARAGTDPGPDPRAETYLDDALAHARGQQAPSGRVGFRCSTLDGTPLDPAEVAAHALIGHVRRVVLGSDSVVIDLGRRQRLFTGPAALAIKLHATHCTWTACHVPTSDCQSDHLTAWTDGGGTDPGNGAPLCVRHNRLKQAGYAVWRDPTGTWHTYRPDGTEIT